MSDAPAVSVTSSVTIKDLGVHWAFSWRPFRAYGRWFWLFYREHRFEVGA